MFRFALPAALSIFAAFPLQASEQVACTVIGCETVNIDVPKFSSADSFSVQEVWSVVNDILAVSGLAPNFQVVETTEVGNAAAVVIEDERYLAFNPIWIDRYKDDPLATWQLYGIMAHEVGHHLQGHTLTGHGSRPPTELEADEYAGFVLAALGASLSQAQSLWSTLGAEGSATHPPRHQRLAAVERGWSRYIDRQGGGTAKSPAQPAPQASATRPVRAGETCRSLLLNLGPATACSSTALAPQGSNSYGITHLFDGNGNTAWVEGVPGNGEGEYVALTFDQPVRPSRIVLRNGYTKSSKSYWDNARVQVLGILASDGTSQQVTLSDTPDWQEIRLDNREALDWIMLRVDSVYPGRRWTDTALSELYVE
ncbi:hypothetical protein AVO45_01440 [Ruegeria marisrubri]|uniref:NAD glycohydrolase translocation F5/8 type C domain-containing protein n=1 Tax=Ruegeria marisrubri TaxID=1685379 RepID=A0A117KH30_9RHOB|nr:hypothetical protein [Ruegeria marisrubri]KUJ85681.1 hypothetical protein AVO45_01440 [Ruegeria marisrubri]